MRLRFLGSGDAFGSGGRFNTCFHLERAGYGNVLIDCGASSMVAIRKFGIDPNRISTVLISHLHGDHFAGLPFFLLDAQLVSRRGRQMRNAVTVDLNRTTVGLVCASDDLDERGFAGAILAEQGVNLARSQIN